MFTPSSTLFFALTISIDGITYTNIRHKCYKVYLNFFIKNINYKLKMLSKNDNLLGIKLLVLIISIIEKKIKYFY